MLDILCLSKLDYDIAVLMITTVKGIYTTLLMNGNNNDNRSKKFNNFLVNPFVTSMASW